MNTGISTTQLIKRSFIEMMKDIGTSIPAHILTFDTTTQLAQIQIAIEGVGYKGERFTPPPLIECPVYFFGGSDYFIECEINQGDEGIVLFSQRCIDAWVNAGGIAENPIARFHDFSDAYFLPGLRSQPNKITNFENDGIRIRDKSGNNHLWLKNDGTIHIKAADVIINDKSWDAHTHNAGLLLKDSTGGNVTGITGVPT